MTPLPKPCTVHGLDAATGADRSGFRPRRVRRPRRLFRKPDLPPAPGWMRCAVIGFAAGSALALLYVAGMFDPLLRLLAWYGIDLGG
ncbi:hypothetical protein KL86APRO_20484 [uncultured Alphaproteobacteria bacterium]|jgi:hypothetical protein|uniref:Uncharacterized protein n=1 Tax=uncultured Alphaproteobacteria bacterium TaxID=91750 RepID=A0A212KKF1_9PROT|nr:hypothetical protein KL86APRO_20484 [uncultured Alphaproteobacteria bacterium]